MSKKNINKNDNKNIENDENNENENYSVSGVLVQCASGDIPRLWEEMAEIPGVDCHFKDEVGKIIITIESSGINGEIRALSQIQKLKGVISADMIYSYQGDELSEVRTEQDGDLALKILGQNPDDFENGIKYGGNVNSALNDALAEKQF